jgi:hypothetical protein
MGNRSSEEFPTEEPSEKPEYGSPIDIINDYNEIKGLILELLNNNRYDNPSEWMKNRRRLNSLLIKHELSPADPDSFIKLQKMATKAFKDLE